MQMSGVITREPVITENVIFTSIRENDKSPMIQMVCFKKHRPVELINMLSTINLDDEVSVEGRLEINPQTKEPQIIIDDISIANKLTAVPDEF